MRPRSINHAGFGLVLAALAASTTFAGPQSAGGLAVGPTRVTLSSSQRTQALTITNDRDSTILMQTQALAWRALGSESEYVVSQDLIISPPVFEIPAGGEQIVRVGLRSSAPTDVEGTYRLLLSEAPGEAEMGLGVRFAFQFDLPVFVQPTEGIKHSLDWTLESSPGGEWQLSAFNRGNAHVQVRAVHLAGETTSLTLRHPAYVLPGGSFSWPVEASAAESVAAKGQIRVEADTDAGPLHGDIPTAGSGIQAF